ARVEFKQRRQLQNVLAILERAFAEFEKLLLVECKVLRRTFPARRPCAQGCTKSSCRFQKAPVCGTFEPRLQGPISETPLAGSIHGQWVDECKQRHLRAGAAQSPRDFARERAGGRVSEQVVWTVGLARTDGIEINPDPFAETRRGIPSAPKERIAHANDLACRSECAN